jgi:hypothetical protein
MGNEVCLFACLSASRRFWPSVYTPSHDGKRMYFEPVFDHRSSPSSHVPSVLLALTPTPYLLPSALQVHDRVMQIA